MNSNYASVTEQAGIFAGNGGFQTNVEDNTPLKGGLIDSTADASKMKFLYVILIGIWIYFYIFTD
ncbi:hypothetical protein BSR42_09885 [Megasphaera cerevisiae]|jgi:filamentous hemagglutinin|nr:hypothetical protein BSR42_09885 [Megasphaera cerevisiae]